MCNPTGQDQQNPKEGAPPASAGWLKTTMRVGVPQYEKCNLDIYSR